MLSYDILNIFKPGTPIQTDQEKDAADWTEAQPLIFTKCSASYGEGRHMTMDYADYFFTEAIGKLRGEKLLFWYPNREV